MKKIIAFFTTAIAAIGEDKVYDLMRELGYDEYPTPELCVKVLDEQGADFSVPFGQMVLEAGKKKSTKQLFRKAAMIVKGSGTTSGMTPEQKSQMGLDWFNAAGGFLLNGAKSAGELANALNGTNKENAQANNNLALALLAREQSENRDKEEKKTLYWILGGVGVLLIVMIFVVALNRR